MDVLILGAEGQATAVLQRRLVAAEHDARPAKNEQEAITLLGMAEFDAIIIVDTVGMGANSASLIRLAGIETPIIVASTVDLSASLSTLSNVTFVRVRNLRYNDVIAVLQQIQPR